MNDRERLIEIIYKGFYISPKNEIKGTAQKAADYLIANGVTVQKHGRWIEGGKTMVDNINGRILHCSKCGDYCYNFDPTPPHNFCPNCGAYMKGDADAEKEN